MIVDVNGAPIGPVTFSLGDAVVVTVPSCSFQDPSGSGLTTVPPQSLAGIVSGLRGAGAAMDVCVRSNVPGARKPFYDTWWPVAMVGSQS